MTATCLPLHTALNAALMATSVFPNPTSPQIKTSIGFLFSILFLTKFIADN